MTIANGLAVWRGELTYRAIDLPREGFATTDWKDDLNVASLFQGHRASRQESSGLAELTGTGQRRSRPVLALVDRARSAPWGARDTEVIMHQRVAIDSTRKTENGINERKGVGRWTVSGVLIIHDIDWICLCALSLVSAQHVQTHGAQAGDSQLVAVLSRTILTHRVNNKKRTNVTHDEAPRW